MSGGTLRVAFFVGSDASSLLAFKSSHIHSMNTVGVCGLPLGPDEKLRNETKSHRKLLLIVGKPLYLPIRAFPKMHKFARAISNMIRPSTHTLTPSISVDGGEDYSRMTLSPSSYSDSLSFSLLSLIPDFIDLPLIRVPPPLILPETPLRERRGFEAFITITPRADVHGKTSAKGQLEPTAGGLPRRRRIVKSINVKGSVVNHASDFDSDSDSYDSEDDM
ncbi:hypothetical protein C8J55DRAFT_610020 [Lentinula edodes]|uniref:Uncharacterized protein n=1 Tax=Lentinula lateritia TaxID=40482 RepID=A0A9W8ZS80_9AGAR|nr:hypothetical protein C8J55DRAFT_610020 [Lentinula edodes]